MNPGVLTHPRLVASLEDAPVVPRGDYDYLVHPLTDGVPRVDGALLQEAAEGFTRLIAHELDHGQVNLLVTAEAMGLPLVAALATRTGIPYVVARKRSYHLPGELPLDQVTGYSRTKLHLNDVRPGDRVAIIDDLISTGGTLRALVSGIREAGATPVTVAACVTKNQDLAPLARELECSVAALAAVEIVEVSHTKRVRVTATDLRAHA